ncbi:hypothetical protein M3Y99_00185800 [Aphelenchoides fujianensis]|nr:hypothetical protein M3Y99_00185800 [Aphelenchoides fujianensis]
MPSEQAALGVCYLCMHSAQWFMFRKTIYETLKVDVGGLKKFLKNIDPSLNASDLDFLQGTSGAKRHRRLPLGQKNSTFLALHGVQ